MRKLYLIICVIWLTLIMSDIAKATIPVVWQADPDGSGVLSNQISRVKLTPDKNNVMVFHYNGGAYGIPTRVDKLDASTGNFVWPLPGYKTVTKPGERISLNGWVDGSGNLFIMGSWFGNTIWKYDSELDTELCSYTNYSGFEYVLDAINDELGNLYVAGMTGSWSNDGSRLVKLDSSCNAIWTRLSKNTSGKDDYGQGIALDSSKNVFRVGTDSSYGASDRGRLIGHNASDGAEFLNYTVNETNSRISGITIDSSDYIYIAYCYGYTPSGQERTVVQKLECNGSNVNVLWEYLFEDIGMYLGRDTIVKHTENSFYMAFNLRQDDTTVPGIAEFDLNGNLLWKDTIDRPGWTLSSIDAKNNYIYVGLTNNADSSQTQVLCVPEPATGPVAYWSFDNPSELGHDDSGNGHNGTVNGAVSADGICGKALSFDGLNDYVDFGTAIGNFGTDAFSVVFWFRTDTERWETIMGKRVFCGEHSFFELSMSEPAAPKHMYIELYDSRPSKVGSFYSNQHLDDNQWHYITIIRQGVEAKLYIDGVLDASNSSAEVVNMSNSASFLLGNGPCYPVHTDFFSGELDEVRIYNRALTAAEIQNLYTTPDVTIYPAQTYSTATCLMTLSADVTDTLAGKVTSGTFTYILKDSAGSQKASGNLTYDTGAVKWAASQTITPGLPAGNYTIQYNIVTAQGRTGSSTGQLFVESVFNLSGRVRDAKTSAALAAVQITIAGQYTQTNSQGQYSFTAIDATKGLTLTATKTGYATYTASLNPPSAGTTIVHDFDMQPAVVGKPVVTSVSAKYDGIFLAGLSVNNDFTATAQWNGTPGTVEFYANNILKATKSGTATGATATFNMGTDFPGRFSQTANKVRVIARNKEGGISTAFEKHVIVIPLAPSLQIISFLLSVQLAPNEVHVAADFDFPQPPIKQVIDLPVIGKFGAEFAANASFDYTVTDGDWEAALGFGAEGKQGKRGRRPTIPGLTRYPRMKLYIGNKEISGKIEGWANGTATVTNGITFNEVSAGAGIGAKLELGRVGLLDLLGPGLSTSVSKIPGLGDLLKTISIIIYVAPELNGEIVFALDPKFAFKRLEVAGDVALEAAYEPDLGICKMRLYVGGKPGVTFQYPGVLIKELRFKAYAGAEFRWWIITLGPFEYVFVNVTIPGKSGMEAATQMVLLVPVISSKPQLRPIDRSYLLDGPPRFVAYEGPTMQIDSATEKLSPIEAFRIIGRQTSKRQLSLAEAQTPIILQADLPLIENVFPYSEPSLAGKGQEIMLLYVSDNNQPNDLQCTDINWLRFDGTNWTEPAPIVTDTRAEFAPQVAFDGDGDAVALWERVKVPDFNTLDIYAMAKEMEIVSSHWDNITQTWNPPTPITDNNYLDHKPLLCGPMADGSVLAVWTENKGNLLMGDSNSPSTLLWSKWNSGTHNWSAPQTLLANLLYRLSESLSGTANKAVYAYTQDTNGDVNTPADQELFTCHWNGQSWASPARETNDLTPDRNVRVAVADDDDVYLVWQRAGDLVMNHNSTGISLVRKNSQTVAFTDYAMTLGPQGNLVLIWQEQSQTGVDAFYSVYDPISHRWSKDNQIFSDTPLERSFAPVWDDVGNLTIAYNRVEIQKTNKKVKLETGEIIEVNDVPTPGRVDLGILKRILVKDLSIQPGDFTAEGANYLPGDQVRLRSAIHNSGDISTENVTVAFYDGQPHNGGVEIGRQTISGWLDGADTAYAEVTWIVPEPAKIRTLYAFADPNEQVTEVNEINNLTSLNIGGTDLSVWLLSSKAQEDGSARIVAEVHNAGAPAAPQTTVSIRKSGQFGSPITTADVPTLTPGRLAQIALDLPAGTLLPGNTYLTVTVDDANEVNDIDPDNDRITFSMYFPMVGDLNLDGIINVLDLTILALDWLEPEDTELVWWRKPDFDNSGWIELADLAIFCENWLWQASW